MRTPAHSFYLASRLLDGHCRPASPSSTRGCPPTRRSGGGASRPGGVQRRECGACPSALRHHTRHQRSVRSSVLDVSIVDVSVSVSSRYVTRFWRAPRDGTTDVICFVTSLHIDRSRYTVTDLHTRRTPRAHPAPHSREARLHGRTPQQRKETRKQRLLSMCRARRAA